VNVEVTRKARKRIDIVDRFWRRQLRALATGTAVGVLYRQRKGSDIYRLLLPKTQQYVYYAVLKAKNTVRILTVWGSRRRPQPNV
jgi:plasmid stabilization system protein ParE